MGQIKNIKLHIVTDIKLTNMSQQQQQQQQQQLQQQIQQQQQQQLQQQLQQLQQHQQQQQQQQQVDLVSLMESVRKSFEKVTSSISKANLEHFPVNTAQKDLAETKVLLANLRKVMKDKNLLGYPAGPVETTNVATKQKQLIDGFKTSLQHSQVNANVIAKAF